MGRVKEFYCDMMLPLSRASGYSVEDLEDLWFEHVEARREDGMKPDWAYFKAVTMAHDW